MINSRFLAAGLGFATVVVSYNGAAAELPVPCASASCGVGFVTSGAGTVTSTMDTLRITQTTDRALFNWSSFNISADGHVIFQQPGASSIALNKIHGGSPSQIFGTLEANGQVYLINQNGILFGKGSSVKVAGLLASTLNMSDTVFQQGLLAPRGDTPALEGHLVDKDGKLLDVSVTVADGAKIATTGNGGRVMLAGPKVDNAGSIETPGGQVVLAAGEKIYLQASTDPSLRGLLVEVDGGGEAYNRLTGQLSAPHGSVTMVGLAVNQQGRISATTTVAENGSVHLLARDTVDHDKLNAGTLAPGTHGGTLEVGSKSSIEVLPDLDDKQTAVDDQPQLASKIEMSGRAVFMRGGSSIKAPGGILTVTAADQNADATSRIHVEAGTQIDLSGSDAELPVERNMVQVELRANELKDSPNQRNGVLRGQKVTVDARVGTPLADVSGAIAAIPKGIAERTSKGGTATFQSHGDVVIATGATIDVSGGKVTYTGGTIQTTQLMGADGKLYDIGTADPLRTYIAAINPTYTIKYDRWNVVETRQNISLGRYVPGYTEGRSAGTVQFVAPAMALNGTLLGTATAGEFQRDPSKVPQGGQLIIGQPLPTYTGLNPDYIAPSVDLVKERPSIAVGDNGTLLPPRTLELPVDFLTEGGFTRTEIYSNGVVTLTKDTPLQLQPGSSLNIVAERTNILSNITAPGGSINVTADQTFGISGLALPRPGVFVADGVSLDVRGLWTNDALAIASGQTVTSPVFKDGGQINLGLTTRGLDSQKTFDAEVVIGSDVSLRASGGAWLQANGTISGGKGGSIALRSGRSDQTLDATESALQIGRNVKLDAFGVQGAKGGSFQLETQRLEIVDSNEWSHAQRLDSRVEDGPSFFQVGSALFSNLGFSSVTLTAKGSPLKPDEPDTLVVRSGTTIDARPRTLQLLDSARTQATGGTVEALTSPLLPLEVDRQASTVTLRAVPERGVPGRLSIEKGSTLFAAARSTFDLQGVGGISLAGQISTSGGTIRALVDVPPAAADSGFNPDLLLNVASSAWLDVSGTALLKMDDKGRNTGDVLAGGTISLVANRGSVAVRDGAILDVSGASAAIDFPQGANVTRVVGSAGGSVEVRAPESILFQADLRAAAGKGETGTAPGGSLSVQLTRFGGFGLADGGVPFPNTARVLKVSPDALAIGPNLPNGLGLLDTRTIANSGIDSLRLESSDSIEFSPGVNISLARQLVVDSPGIDLPAAGSVNLRAPYVAFGNSNKANQTVHAATPGGGTLNVSGDMVELVGQFSLQHVSAATFDSTGDIRMRGVINRDVYRGALNVAGDLTLRAERVYPSTATQFSIVAKGGTDDIVRIQQAAGANSALPLSVAGSVRIEGKQIIQDGTLLAPFGRLDLVATDKLQLTDRSLTSVSGNGGLFPYGQTSLKDWQYTVEGTPVVQSAIPDRRVNLSADSVEMASGARVDLRGGGDLYAYEWTPGTGGSKDALAPGVTPGLYAIVPTLGDAYAPFDPAEFAGSDLKVGDSVYLSGGGGVPAGTYALLPARYALLPGSYLVQAVSGSRDIVPGQASVLSDGTPVVAGYRTFGSTGLGDTRFTGFSIRPGTYGRQLAQYDVSLASDFFPARAQRLELPRAAVPADAAALGISVGSRLDASGRVLTAAATGGRGATIELAAQALEVTAGASTAHSDAVQISAQVLQQWSPGQLLLGGVRNADGKSVDVLADSVVFKDGAQLSLDQMLVVALDDIRVERGAILKSTSAAKNQTIDALGLEDSTLALKGANAGAAVLGVSDLTAINVQREAGATASGHLSIESGALVGTRGDLLIDAPAGGALAANALDGKGAVWQLGAQRIAFGSESISDGFTVDGNLLGRLNQGVAARIAGSQSVDFHDSVHIGGIGTALKEISVITPSMQATTAGIDVVLESQKVLLGGGTADPAAPVTGTSTLRLAASEVGIGPGSLAIGGFATTTVDASSRVRGEGKAALRVAGDLTVNTPVLTSASAADVKIASDDGTVRINGTGASTSDLLARANELGGALSVSGRNVVHAGAIMMPSGLVTLTATDTLSMLDGALIDVSGRTVTAGGRTATSSGGTIALKAGRDSTAGDISVAAGATLNMSGAGQSDAGDLHVLAAGKASLAGTLKALAGSQGRGGSVDLNVGQLDDFFGLNRALEAGGFTELRSVRTSRGDLALGAGESINARTVSLVADGGSVRIGGTINALSDAERSKIDVFGTQGVSIESTATLRADGVGSAGRGGDITLGTSAGRVSLAAGSVLAANGKAEVGSIRIRAPIVRSDGTPVLTGVSGGTDVAISPIASRIEGPATVTIEPVMRFNVSGTQTSTTLNAIRTQVAGSSFLQAANINAVRQRLQPGNGVGLTIEPGIELLATGDLTLGAAANSVIDFSGWRFTTNPSATAPADRTSAAAVSVRAAGNIKVNGVISDGFQTQGSGSSTQLRLRTDRSSTLRFAAGASLDSANPLAVQAFTARDFSLGNNAIVRTGTGDLAVAASNDVVFGTGSSLYTGGLAGAPTISLGAPISLSFPVSGGNLSISAGHDVLGAALNGQGIGWQTRQVPIRPAAWGIDLVAFRWNMGTLGGGDLRVSAGNDVNRLSATAANSGMVVDGQVQTFAGGHLSVSSGRDINSSVFHATNGYNRLEADGQLGSSTTVNDHPVGTLLFMQNDANLFVDARGSVLLEGVYNPTYVLQNVSRPVSYYTYEGSAALRAQSAGGSLTLRASNDSPASLLGIPSSFMEPGTAALPPSVTLQALTGDVTLSGPSKIFQSDAGQLDIFAARDVNARDGGTIVMSSTLDSATVTPLHPLAGSAVAFGANEHSDSARHRDDPLPVFITAGRDILGGSYNLPKAAQIVAGRDIVNTVLSLQNLRESDVTLISAGRDLRYAPDQDTGKIEVGGPGRLDVVAGRNVDLGFSKGITTDGQIRDADIDSTSGADLTVIAGAGHPIDGTKFLDEVVSNSKDYRDVLIAYVERETQTKGLSYDAALKSFKQLTADNQRPLLLELFFRELVASGREATKDSKLGYKRGYAAIDLLFPGSRRQGSTAPGPYKGDISLTFSRIYTLAGGNISLVAPGGLVNVGLANPPPTVRARDASLLGIVAQRAGDVRIFTNDDVLVNASRIFTLGGGNIAIWSTTGDIDAGRGSKSAVSAPPPTVLIDSNGQVVINFAGAVQGSGIRTIAAGDDVKAGDVDLIAPEGTVNAGDAGIGSSGNLNIAAQQVVGLDNIQVGGTSTGVPAETSGLGVSLAGASAAASSASSAASSSVNDDSSKSQPVAPLADNAMSWLEVFVEGFGEEGCKASDAACLQRNEPKR